METSINRINSEKLEITETTTKEVSKEYLLLIKTNLEEQLRNIDDKLRYFE